MARMTDDELIAAIEGMESSSLDAWSGVLSGDRAEALARYRGEPDGTEQEGRSQVVSRDLLDVIEWIMPSLARIFLSGDEIGKWTPVGPQDEEQADIETAVCNHYLMERNDGFTQMMATMRDSLLLRNGYAIGWWKTDEWVDSERYDGMAIEELALLKQDRDVEIVEQETRADPVLGTVYDVKVERKRADEYVAIESVPPDEIRVNRRHRMASLEDADFVQWRREVTIGQLKAEGIPVNDDAPQAPDTPMETTYRNRFDESLIPSEETRDPNRRIVIFKDNWVRLDVEQNGKPKLWRIAYIDGTKDVLIREEADLIPVAAFVSIGYPHSHIGTSIHDLMSDLASIKQALQRQLLDNVYAGNNSRTGVDVTKCNVDDLLVSRPNGVVRGNGNPAEWLMPIQNLDMTGGILQAIEYVDSVKEARTGVTRYSAGLDANTLNKTATGVQAIQSAANQRIEMIARTLAGGYTDLFRIIHRLVSKHSTKPIQLEINGQWQVIDPRSWAKRTQFKVSVGLGTGTPEVQMQKLSQIAQLVMMPGQAMGLVGPEEAYAWGEEFLKAAGYRNTRKFLHEPAKAPKMGPDGQPVIGPDGKPVMEAQMPPQKPDAAVQSAQINAQAFGQVEGQKRETEMAKHQMQLAAQERQAQMNIDADLKKAALSEDTAYKIAMAQVGKDLMIASNKSMLEEKQQALDSRAQMMDQHQRMVEGQAQAVQGDREYMTNNVAQLVESLHNAVKAMQQPMEVEILRDPRTGRAIGAKRKVMAQPATNTMQ